MDTTKRATAVCAFEDHIKADQAVAELKTAGFRDDQIGVAGRDWRKGEDTSAERPSKMSEGLLTGAAAGAGGGALVGLGILAGVIPVLGPVIAGGTLAVILANAAGGAAIAGIVGGLVGLGIPEDEAKYYHDEFQAGRTIVTVKDEGRYDMALAIMHRCGGYNQSRMQTSAAGRV